MGFIQPCFIRKNIPELIKKLEELGYKFSGADHIELDCIVILPHHNTFSVFAAYHFNIYDDSFKTVWKEYIDCGTNEELFLALAALRDDNDYMQWFISDKTKQFYKCTSNKFDFNQEGIANWLCCSSAEYFRKASVKEIIENFK